MVAKKFKVTTKTKLPALREEYDERSLYPWMTIRNEYIEGIQDNEGAWYWPTVKELAERHDMPEKPLQNRIAKERWLEYKKAHQNQVALERQREHAKKLAGRAVKFDEQSVEIAEFAQDLIMSRLQELRELDGLVKENRKILIEAIEAGEWVKVSDLKASAFSGSELESLGKAFATFQDGGRRGLGIKDGENPATQTTNNVTIQQTNIREDMQKSDAERMADMMRVLSNPNLSLPGVPKAEDIVDGEIISDEVIDMPAPEYLDTDPEVWMNDDDNTESD